MLLMIKVILHEKTVALCRVQCSEASCFLSVGCVHKSYWSSCTCRHYITVGLSLTSYGATPLS